MRRVLVMLGGLLVLQTGCVAALGALSGMSQGLEQQSGSTSAYYLFGGADHKTYLGCLCGSSGAESIANKYSDYGSKYGVNSIFNHYGTFGSPYSNDSACNKYATNPPVIVSGTGQFIGRLTLNRYVSGALKDGDVVAWLAAGCDG